MKRFLILLAMLLSAAGVSPAQTGTWSGKIDVQGAKLTIVFHLDEDKPTMDVPDQAAQGIPVQVERTAFGKLTIQVPMIGASYDGMWLGKQIVGTFRQNGLELALTLAPEALNRPQTPRGPFPYATEEVTFSNGEATLAGTLVLPEGCSRTTPVLVLVTGSGQEDRDETLFEHKPFAVIADALGRAGIATLRYDDRGVGGSTGEVARATTMDFKEDALAGIRLLRERFDRVGVIGHSEGGTIALMLAAEKKADFIVTLAAVVVSGRETLLAQNHRALLQAGLDETTTDRYCKALAETFDAVTDGLPMPSPTSFDLPAALQQNLAAVQAQLQLPYLRHFVQLDLTSLLGEITCPVLALNGTLDTQVDCTANLATLKKGLPANGRHLVITTCDGLNHLFQHATTGDTTEYPQIEETISPEVLEIIAAWLSLL